MNNEQLKVNEAGNKNSILSIETKDKISSVKAELSNQVNAGIELAKIEFTEINRLFGEATLSQNEALCFSQNLLDYIKKIEILIGLTPIFQRIQSYCDFVDNALLVPINNSLEKINSICDHKLDSEEAWEAVLPYLGNFAEDTTYLETTKVALKKLYGYIQDKMEWFILSYKLASWETKRTFFNHLNQDSQLLTWTQPWIEIAEKKESSWESALIKSIESLSENNSIIDKRIYE